MTEQVKISAELPQRPQTLRQRAAQRRNDKPTVKVDLKVPANTFKKKANKQKPKKKNKPKPKKPKPGPKRRFGVKIGPYFKSLMNPFLPIQAKVPDVICVNSGTFLTRDIFTLSTGTTGDAALIVYPRLTDMRAVATALALPKSLDYGDRPQSPMGYRPSEKPGFGPDVSYTYTYSNCAALTSVQSAWQQVRPVSMGVKLTSITNMSSNQGNVCGAWNVKALDGTSVITSYANQLTVPFNVSDSAKHSLVLLWKPQDNADFEYFLTTDGKTIKKLPYLSFCVSGGVSGATTAVYQVEIVVHWEGIPATNGMNTAVITPSPVDPEQEAASWKMMQYVPPMVSAATAAGAGGVAAAVAARMGNGPHGGRISRAIGRWTSNDEMNALGFP